MTWNYRVLLIPGGSPLEEDLYVIREVYYNADNEIEFWSQENVSPVGNTTEDLEDEINLFYEAFNEPVLMEQGDTLVEIGEEETDEDFDEPIIDVDLEEYH